MAVACLEFYFTSFPECNKAVLATPDCCHPFNVVWGAWVSWILANAFICLASSFNADMISIYSFAVVTTYRKTSCLLISLSLMSASAGFLFFVTYI